MIRIGLAIAVGLIGVAAVAWNVGRNTAEPERQPTEAEQIIAFCKAPEHKSSPLCKVDPQDPEDVRGAVRDILEQRTTGPQIIERERVTEKDDDDGNSTPRVEVNVPRENPTPQPTSAPLATQRPLVPEVVPIPSLPSPPNLDLPLMP